MKNIRFVVIGAGCAIFMTGCVSHPMALAPVGPDARQPTAAGTKGHLQVFTATEKSIPSASDDPTIFALHTGYDIKDGSWKTIKYVPNHMSNMDEWPDTVTLPAGTYNLVAESTCCGLVTVPVVIASGKTTTVHLDGNWPLPAKTSTTNKLAFLPNGECADGGSRSKSSE